MLGTLLVHHQSLVFKEELGTVEVSFALEMSLSINIQVWLYTLFVATSLTLRISHGNSGARGKRRKCYKGKSLSKRNSKP